MAEDVERRTLRKITWRIVPFIMVLYFIAYIDRVNIGFASLTMNRDLGFSPAVFGFGAGVLALTCSFQRISLSTSSDAFVESWIGVVSPGSASRLKSSTLSPSSQTITLKLPIRIAEPGAPP